MAAEYIMRLTQVPTLNNSIVWGNYGNYGKEVYERDNSYGTPQVNSLVQMLGDDSDGNLDGRIIRPFFSDSTTGNITLLPWSLCIDAGNKSLLTDFDDIDSFDFAGNPRIVNSNVDMGAYECQGAPFSGIVYVKKGSKGNGLSWSNALGELSDALEIARISPKIKKIYVANGVYIPKYTPAYDTTGLDRTFTMIKDVQVYGGFDPGNGITDLTHIRDFTETGTVLSGILAPDANANHVVLAVDDLGNALLDGFTVRNGKSLGIATDSLTIGNIKVARASGAGITLVKTNITLANLQVLENSANVNGGGIHAQYFTGSISHLSIRGNTARANGGGLPLPILCQALTILPTAL
jgi:predicted outer membrane repeat protein